MRGGKKPQVCQIVYYSTNRKYFDQAKDELISSVYKQATCYLLSHYVMHQQ